MKKILIVAMADSVHTARWLEQFERSQHKFVLFPSSPHRRIHPKISYLLSESSEMNIRIPAGLKQTGLVLAIIDKFFANRVRGALLRRQITKINPDILHAVETQGAGYISLTAIKKLKIKPYFMLTLWGSDLYWFRQFKRHEIVLRKLLLTVDCLSMECGRDTAIASELGFEGEIIRPFPVTGGYEIGKDLCAGKRIKTSSRKRILIKGHTRFVGRALTALAAIEKLADSLREYEIIVYSADPKACRVVKKLALKHSLSIRALRRGELSHEGLLRLFETSRVYIGVSLSDGISVSLQEAMVSGAYPIQTDTSCVDEWIVNGQSGSIVSPHDLNGITVAIKSSLENDLLVDTAAEINFETAKTRLDRAVVSSLSREFYSRPTL